MKTINQVLPSDSPYQRDRPRQGDKASKYEPTSRQVAVITRLWEKMAQIFAAKWFTQYGEMLENGQYTDNFLHWCEETSCLTDDQWIEGLAAVERKITADIAHLRDPWPPTAPIFRAMAKPVSTTSGASAASFKRHPNLVTRDIETKQIAEDPSYKERKKQAGNNALSNLKDMF